MQYSSTAYPKEVIGTLGGGAGRLRGRKLVQVQLLEREADVGGQLVGVAALWRGHAKAQRSVTVVTVGGAA